MHFILHICIYWHEPAAIRDIVPSDAHLNGGRPSKDPQTQFDNAMEQISTCYQRHYLGSVTIATILSRMTWAHGILSITERTQTNWTNCLMIIITSKNTKLYQIIQFCLS